MADSKPLLADCHSPASSYGSTAAQSISVGKISSDPYAGQSISFHDIHYEMRGWRRKSRKVILHSERYWGYAIAVCLAGCILMSLYRQEIVNSIAKQKWFVAVEYLVSVDLHDS